MRGDAAGRDPVGPVARDGAGTADDGAATGGAGALISKRIKKSEIVAYDDLGPEAIKKLEVEDFPVIVINDIYGNDLYEQGVREYSRI